METDIQYAGEFFLKEVKIFTSSGKILDLTNMIQGIEIWEDIFSTALSGNIVFADVSNLTKNGPIIGQEHMSLKLGTPGLEDFDIDAVFIINKIGLKQSVSINAEIITLSFISPELMKDNRTRVSKSYTDTISNIVTDVIRDKRYLNSTKRLFIEETAGIRKVISPNNHPFKFLTTLATEAISNSGSQNFVLFENTRGIHFKSMDKILNSDTIGDYYIGDVGLNAKYNNKVRDVEKDFQRPLSATISQNNDLLLNTMGGMLSSKIIKYNIYNKTYETSHHNYFEDFEGNNTIDSNPVYSDNPIDVDGNNISSFSDARIHLHPVNSNGVNDILHTNETSSYSYAPIGTTKNFLQRQSKFLELSAGISVTLQVNGNNTIACGETVYVQFPTVGGYGEGDGIDEYYTGKYIINKLKHQFDLPNKRHTIQLTVSKDSISTKISVEGESIEPFGGSGDKINVT